MVGLTPEIVCSVCYGDLLQVQLTAAAAAATAAHRQQQ